MGNRLSVSAPDISVVVVSYNTADLIGPCLASVLVSQGVSLEVFVVDNASSDGSADLVRDLFPAVRLMACTENRGFGSANNLVLPECRGRYIVLLNPDTVVDPGALRDLVVHMDDHPSTGLAGPRLVNPDGTPQNSVSYRYPGQKHTRGELDGLVGPIACVMGACQIVRAGLMKDLGGFDEDFFLYGEDEDLCLRIRRKGYDIGYVPAARVVHHGGQSERRSTPFEVWRKKAAAEYLFYDKHYRPETIGRIRRKHMARALWRMVSIWVLLPLAGDRDKTLSKLQKYRALYEAAVRYEPGGRLPGAVR